MTFYWTLTTVVVSITVLIVTLICCVISWRRSGCSRRIGCLEGFRFALIAIVLFTLNQPEVTQEYEPEEQPALVVLHDVSGSMQTRDVVDPNQPAKTPQTRIEAIAPHIDTAFWAPVADRMDVIIEPFSSRLARARKGTDINEALLRTADQHPNLRGIVVMSDGDWNTGVAPNAAATELRMKGVPVYAVAVGSQERLPDVELVSLDAPTFGVVGKTLRIPFRIVSWLPRDRDIKVRLRGTEGESVTKDVRVSGMGQIQDTLEWRPEKTGDYSLTLQIPVDETETNADNNALSVPITVRNEALKVLVVESYPRWEYRYLRNALERDPGVEVNCLLFHPTLESVGGGRGYLEQFPAENELFEYDVVFLGDVGVENGQLTVTDCLQLRQLVKSHAAGLVFLPGFRGHQKSLLTTELEELYPVVPDSTQPRGFGLAQPARFSLTESGRRSLLTRLESRDEDNEQVWRALPGYQWYAATLRAKIGTEVLATHDSESTRFGRVPLIATRTSGTGKILFMGTDGAWRWRKGVEDLYHYRFWGQVVRWMAYQRNMSQGDRMRLFYSPDRPEAENVLTLNANVMTLSGEPLRHGAVIVQVVAPSGQTESVRLAAASDDSWGLFTGSFTPREGGVHKLVTSSPETGATLETQIPVQGLEKEQTGQPARFEVLKEVAEVSRGQLATVSDIETLVDSIATMPEPEKTVRRFRLWSHPAWAGGIVFLLGLFWTGRKFAGLA